jgi:hypothetical protein
MSSVEHLIFAPRLLRLVPIVEKTPPLLSGLGGLKWISKANPTLVLESVKVHQ